MKEIIKASESTTKKKEEHDAPMSAKDEQDDTDEETKRLEKERTRKVDAMATKGYGDYG